MIPITEDKNIRRRILPDRDPNRVLIQNSVSEILREVYEKGDAALLDFTERFDGVRPERLEVRPEELDALASRVPEEVLSSLKKAYDRILRFHSAQKREGFRIEGDGEILLQRVVPLRSVGLYVPGGTAPYPSTVLMDAVPAIIAGVKELIMVSPPTCNGDISPVIAAAAKLTGVTRVFRCGGAQAIAALAFGTESIPAVDKIVGPGNVYVAEAKKQVFGTVGIDLVSGPSEVVIVADDPFDYIDLIENAGSVFLGRFSMVPIGDYLGGTNHALPTGGSARFASPLSVDDFVKKSTFSCFTKAGLDTMKDDIAVLARAEGFEGHARSALSRQA